MKQCIKAICAGCCVVVLLAVSLITPAMARYSNTAFMVSPYGQVDTILADQTLSAETEVYDFGVYTQNMDISDFTHTIRLVDDEPISGTLRFVWDEDTQQQNDITVNIDTACYSEIYSDERYTDYSVFGNDGLLEVPFWLTFAPTEEERLAKLEVSWYPNGAEEATMFARYWVALVNEATEGTIPTFIEDESVCITRELLQVTVTTPGDYLGVLLTPADDVFTEGMRYCNAVCTEGAVLLRDSALFVPRTSETARMYIDVATLPMEDERLSLRVKASDTLYSDLTCTLSDTAGLTMSMSDGSGLLTVDTPLTVTLTTPSALYDDDWSQAGHSPSDLEWRVYRRVGYQLEPITVGEHLNVDVQQNGANGTMTISLSGDEQSAGSYVLMITQTYFDHPVMKTPVWFFIDYR